MTGSAGGKAILADLTAIGFTDHEARIYLALVSLGRPAIAYEIAKAASIPVANTYNVIRSLAKKGATKQVADAVTYEGTEARPCCATRNGSMRR
jgi:hypothetical protein